MSLFISLDLGTNSSGNSVSEHELEFLKSIDCNGNNSVIQLGYQDISPTVYHLPDNPFLVDYLTMNKISQLDLSEIDIAHFYGGPYTNTIRYLNAKRIKTTLTIAAHDRMESIKEFGNSGYDYPYNHVKDNILWKIYNGEVIEADILITPSKISAEFLKSEGVDPNRIRIIPHGIDIPTPDKIKAISNEFNIGYLGAMGPDKGLKYLIQAWSSLNYSDSTLIFAGRGTEQLKPFIDKYANGGKFHLMGYVPNISDFYNLCSVYVQPSVTEGFGIEVLEAVSYGRPVIASDGCGAADCIENGETGFIVPKRDPDAIADKIAWFRNHQQELYIMGSRCKEIAKNYSWDKIREKYIDLWKSI